MQTASPAMDHGMLQSLASKMNVPRERMPDELPDPPAHTTPKNFFPVEAVVTEEAPPTSAEADIPIAVTAVVTTGEEDASAAPLPALEPPPLAQPAAGEAGALQLAPPTMPVEAFATVDEVSDGMTTAEGQQKAKRLKRKEMAEMGEDELSRRTWCLKCKQDGKSRWSWKGSRTDARNGLRHHMKMAHQLTMEQAKQKAWIEM